MSESVKMTFVSRFSVSVKSWDRWNTASAARHDAVVEIIHKIKLQIRPAEAIIHSRISRAQCEASGEECMLVLHGSLVGTDGVVN